MDDTTILSIAGIVISLLSGAYVAFKHSSCRSKCFGVENDLHIDLTPIGSDFGLEKNKESIQNGGTGESKDKRPEEATH
jgi:hypothetical protein